VTRRIALQDARLRQARESLERFAIHGLASAGYVSTTSLEPPAGCRLVHSAQKLLRGSTPYVVDFECIEVFCLYQRVALGRPWARRKLFEALAEQRCHALLPWSKAAERGLDAALGAAAAQLKPKTVTILPAIRARAAIPQQRTPGPLRVLFIGTAFESKGGVEAIRAVARARETHEVALDMVSDVPERWRTEIEAMGGITLHSWPATSDTVESLFERSDVLLFPSHMDTLGFVILEAMAHGMPVLATRHFAVPELVEDGVSGLIVEGENLLYGEDGLCRFNRTLPPPRRFREGLAKPSSRYVDRLAGALADIAGDSALHERLAAGALARVVDGPLSLGRRRQALADV
jgi:glycosyltransferase involved in cell wall biosynthesis